MVDPSQLSNQDLVEAALGYDNASAHADELRQELLRRLRPYIELTPQPERQSRGQAQLEQLREAVTRPTNMSDLLRGLLTIAELLHEQNEITRGSME